VIVNNRAIMPKDMEQDIVLAPADYWEHFLEPKLENLLCKKNRPIRSNDTTIVVSVMERLILQNDLMILVLIGQL
jgi:hypothetical protein